MNLAIIGYGKMGRAIEELAIKADHNVVMRISSNNRDEFTVDNLRRLSVDVAIEFTNPHSAYHNITTCFEAGVKVVSGSTGWLDDWDKTLTAMKDNDGSFLYASNFSVGMNIFFALNKYLANMMEAQDDYNVEMKEIHHTAKLDAPSGTAVTLANDIIKNINRKNNWVQGSDAEKSDIHIESVRQDPAPGTHEIKYSSIIDDIEIKHTAKSRIGFAKGAILAAEYLLTKKGLHSMQDVLKI